jgi:hypothetical protein
VAQCLVEAELGGHVPDEQGSKVVKTAGGAGQRRVDRIRRSGGAVLQLTYGPDLEVARSGVGGELCVAEP